MLYYIKRTLGIYSPIKAKRLLYLALVRSHLEFATVAWAPITIHNMKLMESVQRRATIFICNNEEFPYELRLVLCKLLPLTYRREILDLLFAHKGISGALGPDIRDILPLRTQERRTRRDDHGILLANPSAKTETFFHCYQNRIVGIWNDLPRVIKDIEFTPKSRKFCNALVRMYWNKLASTFDVMNTCSWVTKCRCPTCRA